MIDIVIAIFELLVLLFSVIIHELAHGSVAYSLGDPTAKYQGRLTLNPLKHLDWFGSVLLPLALWLLQSPVLIGWAKPVPINPYNFRDQKWGQLKVAAAGPLSNIALALVFGLVLRFVAASFWLAVPGLYLIFTYVVQINILLAVFNLVPIPPLDGHWILFRFIPERFTAFRAAFMQYGIFLLLFFIFFGGLQLLGYVMAFFFRLITGM